jgi:hypothetical protein
MVVSDMNNFMTKWMEKQFVTSLFLIPKLEMFIVNMMYGRRPSDVICKLCILNKINKNVSPSVD